MLQNKIISDEPGWISDEFCSSEKKRCKFTTKLVKEYKRCFPIVSLCSLFAFLFQKCMKTYWWEDDMTGRDQVFTHRIKKISQAGLMHWPAHTIIHCEQKSARDILNDNRREGTASRRYYKSVFGIKLSPHEKVRMRSCPHNDAGHQECIIKRLEKRWKEAKDGEGVRKFNI